MAAPIMLCDTAGIPNMKKGDDFYGECNRALFERWHPRL